jgi:LuxR family maltose regulon positive regulatory protein
MMTVFINDVVPVSSPFLLILDDYHAIDSVEIDRAMAFLLDHMPPQMRLVITSRADPGFPISRLRARGELTELRVNDLRFSEAEVAQFFEQSMNITLSSDHIAALEARTEGWIAGLQMAALSMQDRDDIDGFVASFTGSHRFIMDYLVEEVLNHLPTDQQDFLLQTAVLTRLCGDLCDVVRQSAPTSSPPASQQILEQLETHNIFLVSLDDERRWYRYHHLFAELLRQKNSAQTVQFVYKQAATWSLQNHLIEDAIEYALAAADYDFATPLLVEHGLRFLFQGKLTALLRWLNTFPRDYLMQRPRLCLHTSWALLNQGRLHEIEPYLLAAENAAQENDAIRAVTALIRGNVARTREDIDMAQSETRIALQLTDSDNVMMRGAALFQLGAVQMMTGEVADAIETLPQADLFARQAHNLNAIFLIGGHLGLAYLLQENVDAAEDVLQTTKAYATQLGLQQSPLLCYVHIGLAHLAFLNNELALAKLEIEQAISHLQFMNEVGGLRWATMLLVQIEQAAGQFSAAKKAFDKVIEATVSPENKEISQQLHLLKGTLTSQRPPADLAKTVRFLAAGAPFSYAQAVSEAQPSQPSPPSSTHPNQLLLEPLTERELEILTLIAAGLKNKEIAQQLIISLNTVLYHIKNIYGKLGVRKRVLAIAKAKEVGLL